MARNGQLWPGRPNKNPTPTVPKIAEITKTDWLGWMPPAGKQDAFLSCRAVRGLALRVRLNSAGVWLREAYLRYEWRGSTRVKALGPVGTKNGWTLPATQEKVRLYRAMIKQAELENRPDPLASPEVTKPRTLAELSADYTRLASSPKNEARKKEEESRWRRLLAFAPPGRAILGDLAVDQITTMDLQELSTSMAKTPTEANRTLALASAALGKAIDWGYVREDRALRWKNPARAVERYAERQRDQPFRGLEFAAIVVAAGQLIEEVSGNLHHKNQLVRLRTLLGVRILARCGARPGEILGLTSDAIYWTQSLADLPTAKGDRKKKRGRRLAFGSRALADLRRVEQLRGKARHLFLGTAGKPLSRWGFRNAWNEIKALADQLFGTSLVAGDADLYKLRHTFISAHEPAGVDFGQVVELAGHSKKGSTTFGYRHTGIDRLAVAVQAIEDYLEGLVMAESPGPTVSQDS